MRACSTRMGVQTRRAKRRNVLKFAPTVRRSFFTARYSNNPQTNIEPESSSGVKVQNYNVLQCNPGGYYCCRNIGDTKNCCNGDSIFSTNIGLILLPTRTISVSGIGTVAVTHTSTTTPTLCNFSQALPLSDKCPKDNTAVVGGAVGGVLGAALLAALGTIAALTFRKPKNKGRCSRSSRIQKTYSLKLSFQEPWRAKRVFKCTYCV